jgi:hypothetical protein
MKVFQRVPGMFCIEQKKSFLQRGSTATAIMFAVAAGMIATWGD